MISMNSGIVISGVEVVQLSPYGLWIEVEGKEYFLDHENYPWFKQASVEAVWKVELDQTGNLHWPELDVDLERASLDRIEGYPLLYSH